MSFKTLLFDLDDTLYPCHSGIWNAVGDRMNEYMISVLGFNPENVARIRDEFWMKYGTTFRGLRSIYNIEPHPFLDYVHDIPLVNYIRRDELLAGILKRIPGKKVIFTNASQRHAENVLDVLGVRESFEQIIDIMQIDPYCKPLPEAFQKAMQLAKITDPGNCVVIDDQVRNLQTAHELGFYTIQVGTEVRTSCVDVAILSLADLVEVIPLEMA